MRKLISLLIVAVGAQISLGQNTPAQKTKADFFPKEKVLPHGYWQRHKSCVQNQDFCDVWNAPDFAQENQHFATMG